MIIYSQSIFLFLKIVFEQHLDSIDLELSVYGLSHRSLMLKNQTDHDLDIQNNHETILGKIYLVIKITALFN
jgi:hypothetical protein